MSLPFQKIAFVGFQTGTCFPVCMSPNEILTSKDFKLPIKDGIVAVSLVASPSLEQGLPEARAVHQPLSNILHSKFIMGARV